MFLQDDGPVLKDYLYHAKGLVKDMDQQLNNRSDILVWDGLAF